VEEVGGGELEEDTGCGIGKVGNEVASAGGYGQDGAGGDG
jgi:hypothetical protein